MAQCDSQKKRVTRRFENYAAGVNGTKEKVEKNQNENEHRALLHPMWLRHRFAHMQLTVENAGGSVSVDEAGVDIQDN